MVRRCWVNFQCRAVLLIWKIVGQRPIALAVGAGGGCLDIFSLGTLPVLGCAGASYYWKMVGQGPIFTCIRCRWG